jgi:ATP-binding cassette subfamily B protein
MAPGARLSGKGRRRRCRAARHRQRHAGDPSGLKLIVDKGFSQGADITEIGRWFRYLLLVVLVLAIGTACRFYFVSWLGERVVADIRLKVQANLLRLPPSFFESNSPKEISSRMTSDTAIIEQVVGTTVSVALRNAIMALGGMSTCSCWRRS